MKFEDKVVMITGSGSGIGRTTAILFAEQGAKVVISDINETGGKETVDMIKESGGEAHFISANVADYTEVTRLIQQTVEKYGRLDIAVNNAGIGEPAGKTADHKVEYWDKVIAVNQTGVFYCMKEELTHMSKQGSGAIVNIASVAGLKGLPNSLAYVASKHAVVGMTKTASMEYAKHNIRINAVCPVFTVTPMFQPELYGELAHKFKAAVPMKRFGEQSEIAKVILFLSSEDASFVTGHAMPVDGGLTA